MTYVISSPCLTVMDKACVDVCPVDCIHFDEDIDTKLFIDPEECIDCEACVPECPVEAIFHEDNVPEGEEGFTALNAEMASQCEVITEQKEPLADS